MHIKNFFLVFVPLLCIYGPIKSKSATLNPGATLAITPIDEIIDEGQKQLNQVAIALSTVSGIINDKVATTVEDQQTAIAHIKSLNSLIGTLRKEKFALVDLHTAYSLLQFTKAITDHVLCVLENRFVGVQDFNIESLIKKAVVDDEYIEIEQILDLLLENEPHLKQLTKEADSFGLRWYNYAYRTLDDWIITPAQRHEISKRSLTGSAIAFLACYAWWRLGTRSFVNYAPDPIVRLFGTEVPDHNMALQNDIIIQKPHWVPRFLGGKPEKIRINRFERLGPIGKLDYFIGEVLNNWSPIGKHTALFIAGALALEWKHNQTGVKKKITEWTNWLRGGSYLREAQRAAERVEQVYFSDIFGQEDIIRYFQLIVDYLANPEPFDRLGLTPPKGILCVGDTRTGKTYAVTALFNEIMDMFKKQGQSNKFKFFNLSAAKINYYGIKSLLVDIKRSAPCVVFIDELDLLDLQRTGKNETLSEFLTCMSGTLNSKDSKNQVIIIAATNRPENLDVALRQPGRFGKELRFEYPNTQDRENFIKHKLEKLSIDLTDFDIHQLAQATHKKSYEALKMLIDNSLLKARINDEMITQAHIEETLAEDVYHILPSNTKHIPAHETQILGAHFAGQSLALMLLDGYTKLSKVTIKQVMTDIKEEMMGMHLWGEKDKQDQKRFEYGKIFLHHDHDSINMNPKDEKINLCKFYLAGFAAEEILLGACSYSCHAEDDKANALAIAQSLVLEGLDMNKIPVKLKEKKFEEVLSFMSKLLGEIRSLLAQHKETLQKISDALQKKGSLNRHELCELIKTA